MRLNSARRMFTAIALALACSLVLAACGGESESESLDTINSAVETSLGQLDSAVKSARASSSSTMVDLRAAAESATGTLSDAIEQVDDLEVDSADASEITSYRKGLVAERELAEALSAARPSATQIQLAAAKAKLALNASTGEQLTAVDVSALVHSIKKSRSNKKSSSQTASSSSGTNSSSSSSSSSGGASRSFYAGQGNVSCQLTSSSALCSVASAGTTFVLEGSSPGRRESGTRISRGSGSYAPYGSSVSVGDFSCSIPPESSASGITCRNSSSGHGFEASRVPARQKTY